MQSHWVWGHTGCAVTLGVGSHWVCGHTGCAGHTGCGDAWRLEAHGNFIQNLQVALGDAQWKHGRAQLWEMGSRPGVFLARSTCVHAVAPKVTGEPRTSPVGAPNQRSAFCQVEGGLFSSSRGLGAEASGWLVARWTGPLSLGPISEEDPCVVAVRAASPWRGVKPVCTEDSTRPQLRRAWTGFAHCRPGHSSLWPHSAVLLHPQKSRTCTTWDLLSREKEANNADPP